MTAQNLTTPRRDHPLAGPTGRSAAITALAVVGAVILLGIAVLLVQQVLVSQGSLAGDGWVVQALTWVSGLQVAWVAALGLGVALVGIAGVVAALGAGRPRELQLPARHGLVVTDGDVARLASATATSVSGVLSASSVAAQRRLTVRVSSTGSDRTAADVESAVTAALGGLGLQRQVRVVTQTPSASPVTAPAVPTTGTESKERAHA